MNAEHLPRKRRTSPATRSCMPLGGILFALTAAIVLLWFSATDRGAKLIYPKAVMKSLEIAIKGYKTEYLTLPFIGETPPSEDNQAYDTSDANGRKLMDVLLARDTKNNPRLIRFWEAPPGKRNGSGYTDEAGLKDSWGKQGYKVILDYDGDGRIANPYAEIEGEPDEITADVILYSAGANGVFEEAGPKDGRRSDDVRSWQ